MANLYVRVQWVFIEKEKEKYFCGDGEKSYINTFQVFIYFRHREILGSIFFFFSKNYGGWGIFNKNVLRDLWGNLAELMACFI